MPKRIQFLYKHAHILALPLLFFFTRITSSLFSPLSYPDPISRTATKTVFAAGTIAIGAAIVVVAIPGVPLYMGGKAIKRRRNRKRYEQARARAIQQQNALIKARMGRKIAIR